ncbi:EthD family reductase [Nocardia sp. JMUB6875]|uniref:EthD family reductase n=1 Tax=Nocardia sp. JMUB6875 TaxID=3158170 RepID=UPI0032E60402
MSTEPGTVKFVGSIIKRNDLSFEEFLKHWTEVHTTFWTGANAEATHLLKYVVNPIDRRQHPDSPIDGFAELWFPSQQALDDAFAGAIGQAAMADMPNFTERLFIAYVVEIPVVP